MKRLLSISVLLQGATILLTVMLVFTLALNARQASGNERQARRVPVLVDISKDLFSTVQEVRLERAMLDSALRHAEPVDSATKNEIATRRVHWAKSLDKTLVKLAGIGIGRSDPSIIAIHNSISALAVSRSKMDSALLLPRDWRATGLSSEWLVANGRVVNAIEAVSDRLEDELSQLDSFIANMMQIKQMAWVVRSDTGNDRLLLRDAVASGGHLSVENRNEFEVLAGRIEANWKLVQEKAGLATTPQALKTAIDAVDHAYFAAYLPVRNGIIANLAAGLPVRSTESELQKFTAVGQQSIFAVADTTFELSLAHAAGQLDAAKRNFYTAIVLMLAFGGIGIITAVYVVNGVVRPITALTDTMRSVADGNLDCAIPYKDRGDEIGSLARALWVFRANAIEKRELRIAKDGAEAANRAKSIFLANMSHELRTPLNAVIGFSEIIMRELYGAVNPRYRSYALDILNSGTHLLGLINEILDTSKLEAGQIELHEENIDLAFAIPDCLPFVESQAEHSKLQLIISVAADLPLLRADSRRIRQILLNLLSNAIKFTPAGGNVRVKAFRHGEGLAITVQDTGIGMAPEHIPKALELFGQIDSLLSRRYEGTGLGLPLAKRLVELSGGRLTIESKVGSGTTIIIFFPRERVVSRPAFRSAPPQELMASQTA